MSAVHELVLDREVRDWVLIPLTACVLLMQLLRQYVTQVSIASGWERMPDRPPCGSRPLLPPTLSPSTLVVLAAALCWQQARPGRFQGHHRGCSEGRGGAFQPAAGQRRLPHRGRLPSAQSLLWRQGGLCADSATTLAAICVGPSLAVLIAESVAEPHGLLTTPLCPSLAPAGGRAATEG